MADNKKTSEEQARFETESEQTLRGFVAETIKKLFTAGVGAAFMTEESIRKYLSDIKLPREVLSVLLQGANKSKEELMNVVTNEVVNVIKKIDFVKEASRFVEDHKFRVTAEIEVIKKSDIKSDADGDGKEISTQIKVL